MFHIDMSYVEVNTFGILAAALPAFLHERYIKFR